MREKEEEKRTWSGVGGRKTADVSAPLRCQGAGSSTNKVVVGKEGIGVHM